MIIEAIYRGELLKRMEIADECLSDVEGASWQENADARAAVVDLHLEAFAKQIDRIFGGRTGVTYVLVFQSKIKDVKVNDLEGIEFAKKIREKEKARAEQVVKLSATMTPAEIVIETGLGTTAVYKYLKLAGIDTGIIARTRREEERKKLKAKVEEEKQRSEELKKLSVDKGRQPYVRPPAEYSNSSPWGIATEFHNQKAAS